MTWQEVVDHPSLQDLPFRIELNGQGNIVMSPTRPSHSGYQGKIIRHLIALRPDGMIVPECAIQTSDNVKVPDVCWFTEAHWQIAEHELACSQAAAICVEVASRSNAATELTQKKTLYFKAGAEEVWFCDLQGRLSFFDAQGEITTSQVCPGFPANV